MIHHGQDQINFPGKNKWPSIDISFYQVLGGKNDVAGAIYEWWTRSVVDISKSKINLIKRTCELQQLDGSGVGVYIYTIYGCYISKVKPDDLDYSSSAISEITFTLEMDKAIETRGRAVLDQPVLDQPNGAASGTPVSTDAQSTRAPPHTYTADDIARENAIKDAAVVGG
jgi:hypothetical protein